MRILFYTYSRVDYGADLLYDGLCRILGSENVVEQPIKPTLHGQPTGIYRWYPDLFNYPVQEKAGKFDIILFACRAPGQKQIPIPEDMPDLPLFLVALVNQE